MYPDGDIAGCKVRMYDECGFFTLFIACVVVLLQDFESYEPIKAAAHDTRGIHCEQTYPKPTFD